VAIVKKNQETTVKDYYLLMPELKSMYSKYPCSPFSVFTFGPGERLSTLLKLIAIYTRLYASYIYGKRIESGWGGSSDRYSTLVHQLVK
jgi:hypothetical protein